MMRTALLLAAMTALFLAVGYLIAGEGGALIAFVIALAMNGWAYWNSDKMVLRMHNARPVTRASAPDLVGLVEQLARRAELPMPAVYVLESNQPNAFATGRNPENSAVAVTRGLIQSCDPEELAGVIAHELGHIKNRDTLTMTITATLAGAIGFLSQFAFFLGGGRDNRNPLGAVGMLLVMILAPLAAMLVQMAISRTREYSADRVGARSAASRCGSPGRCRRSSSWRAAWSTSRPSATPPRRTCSSSIPCAWAGSTACSAPTRRPRIGCAGCASSRARSQPRPAGRGGSKPPGFRWQAAPAPK